MGLNTRWKVPISYFQIYGLTTPEKVNLILNCLKLIHDYGGKIVSLTFDGTATNFVLASVLGAKLYFPNMQSWFLIRALAK